MSYFISASLFPSPVTPSIGLFVAHRLNALKKHFLTNLNDNSQFFIASPTSYFPFKHAYFKKYALYAQKPKNIINYQGFDICYPRFIQIPATNSHFSGYLSALSLEKYLKYHIKHYSMPKKMIAEYGFPDAVALYHLYKKYDIPYVVTLRGSDISYFMTLKTLKNQIVMALNNAETIICVSNNMKHELLAKYHISENKIIVIGNGVQHDVFYHAPHLKKAIQKKYNIKTPYLISSVGGLIPRKNHALAIKAMQFLPHHSLVIAGSGDEYQNLTDLIHNLNLNNRVFLIGTQTQKQLCDLYNASDLFLLCSLSEGRPNVVLEALACGTPVLTNNVHGVDELITDNTYGKIMHMISDNTEQLAKEIDIMSKQHYDARLIQNHGHKFSWEKSAILYANALHK